jgi:predicted transcriptional regulator
MTRNQIPPEVREFVRREIKSVFQLEVLLLLHRTRERAWTVMEVSQELGIDPEIAGTEILNLTQLGLIRTRDTTPTTYFYEPEDQTDELVIDNLAILYGKQRVGIFSLILSDSNSRIRRFAEAFRLIRGAD